MTMWTEERLFPTRERMCLWAGLRLRPRVEHRDRGISFLERWPSQAAWGPPAEQAGLPQCTPRTAWGTVGVGPGCTPSTLEPLTPVEKLNVESWAGSWVPANLPSSKSRSGPWC